MSNPIDTAVASISARIATLPADKVTSLESSATLDSADWITFGDKPSLALAMGLVDADTAQRLHAIHTDFNTSASLAERVVFLQCMSELLPTLLGR